MVGWFSGDAVNIYPLILTRLSSGFLLLVRVSALYFFHFKLKEKTQGNQKLLAKECLNRLMVIFLVKHTVLIGTKRSSSFGCSRSGCFITPFELFRSSLIRPAGKTVYIRNWVSQISSFKLLYVTLLCSLLVLIHKNQAMEFKTFYSNKKLSRVNFHTFFQKRNNSSIRVYFCYKTVRKELSSGKCEQTWGFNCSVCFNFFNRTRNLFLIYWKMNSRRNCYRSLKWIIVFLKWFVWINLIVFQRKAQSWKLGSIFRCRICEEFS